MDPEIKTIPPAVLRTAPRIVDPRTDIDDALKNTADELFEFIEEFEGGRKWLDYRPFSLSRYQFKFILNIRRQEKGTFFTCNCIVKFKLYCL